MPPTVHTYRWFTQATIFSAFPNILLIRTKSYNPQNLPTVIAIQTAKRAHAFLSASITPDWATKSSIYDDSNTLPPISQNTILPRRTSVTKKRPTQDPTPLLAPIVLLNLDGNLDLSVGSSGCCAVATITIDVKVIAERMLMITNKFDVIKLIRGTRAPKDLRLRFLGFVLIARRTYSPAIPKSTVFTPSHGPASVPWAFLDKIWQPVSWNIELNITSQ